MSTSGRSQGRQLQPSCAAAHLAGPGRHWAAQITSLLPVCTTEADHFISWFDQAEPGCTIKLGRVLAHKAGGKFTVGQPYLGAVTVEALVLEELKGPKLIVRRPRCALPVELPVRLGAMSNCVFIPGRGGFAALASRLRSVKAAQHACLHQQTVSNRLAAQRGAKQKVRCSRCTSTSRRSTTSARRGTGSRCPSSSSRRSRRNEQAHLSSIPDAMGGGQQTRN